MNKKWTSGKIIAVVFGTIGAGVVLIVSAYASLRPLARNIRMLDGLLYGAQENRDENADFWAEAPVYDPENSGSPESADEEDFDRFNPDKYDYDDLDPDEYDLPDEEDWRAEQDLDEEYSAQSGEYYEFHNEISKDLSYQIRIEEFSEFAEENKGALAGGNYPKVICEDKKKEERVNNIIYEEIESVLDHLEYVGGELDQDMLFMFDVESYVTYMDEDTLSVAYVEYGYLDDEWFESYVISVNIDMESGMEMTNSQILSINDDFSIDFRERTEKQNGSNNSLDIYSDQEITQMLNDEDSLIIFYTPLGMEVGFNYFYGWVTVTYPDYAKFVNPL